jgi:glucose-6-phosphate isomerase
LENADPETLSAFENTLIRRYKKLDYSRVAVNVISKSGTTAETAANFELVIQHMRESGLPEEFISKKVIATTDLEKGTLRKIAFEKGYRTLVVPEGVGGRFSVFSDVGLLPLAVGGADIRKILHGVRNGLERSRINPHSLENHAYQIGSLLFLLDEYKGQYLHGLFLFGEAFEGIAAWFEQLWAESLGKDGKGPRPLGMIGARALHGVHQDNLGGKPNKAFLFVSVQESRIDEELTGQSGVSYFKGNKMSYLLKASMQAAIHYLTRSGRPNMSLVIPRIDEMYLGELLFTFEMATHVAGRLYDVNPYDQPAVEEAKIGARKALSEAQKLDPELRSPKILTEITLSLENIRMEKIGDDHGLNSDEIASVKNRLNDVHQEIEDKLANAKALNESWMGWLKMFEEIQVQEIEQISTKISRENDFVLIIGMGGATSGSRALIEALNYLGPKSNRPEILFLENADPESLTRFENQIKSHQEKIDYSRVAVNIISQSGKTTETLANLECILKRMEKQGLHEDEIKNKIFVTTNFDDGILLDLARKNKYFQLCAIKNVMGVFGVFGNVGLLPLALSGNSLSNFIQGVRKGLKRARLSSQDQKNHAYRLAEAFYLLDTRKNKDLHGFFMYGDAFQSLAGWLEQLWAEALGKSETVGPRPLPMIGTTAQHSVNQDNIAGRNNKAILFIGTHKSRIDFMMQGQSVDYLARNRMSELLWACLEGTSQALTVRQRPNMTMILPEINEEVLGEFLFTMAMTVHVTARLYGVDPYQQSAVEKGKVEVIRILQEIQGKR